jgi:hypothetical protein
MKYKSLMVFILFAGIATSAFAQTASRGRGFYLDTGIGFGGITYNYPKLDDQLKSFADEGAKRMIISIDLCAGGAISQNMYIVGSLSGFGDRLTVEPNWVQLSTVLVGFGLRVYPFPTKIQFGLDIGRSQLSLSSNTGDEMSSPSGFAIKASIAYDFGSRAGIACLLGINSLISFIDGETISGISGFIKLAYR